MNTPKPAQPRQAPQPQKKKPFAWKSTAIFLVLAGILIADYKGWLNDIQDKLDSPEFSYEFGKYDVSVYILLQGLLVITVVFWVACWAARLGVRRNSRMRDMHSSSKILAQKIFTIVIYLLAGLMTINVLGLDLMSFTVIGGALGIGLGFGLQKIASNFISGLILLFERSVKVGDLIEMEDGTLGYVRRNSARYTLIETTNMREIMIPNEQFIIDKVVNWTLNNKQGRLDISVGVAYDSDLDQVQRILLEAAAAHPAALNDPRPQCLLRKFGPLAVEFMLLVWISDVTLGRNNTQSEIMFDIWNRFKAAGIKIPFPQYDLALRSGALNG